MRFKAWVSVAVLGGIGALVAGGDASGDVETARRAETTFAERFEALRRSYAALGPAEVEKRLGAGEPAKPPRLTFDPTRVKYFDLIRKGLAFTPEEERLYRKNGMVSIDHGQRYSMAGSYLAIYRNDLPVLITVDSILHAMHRSFDAILSEVEAAQLVPAMEKILAAAHERLKAEAAKLPGGKPNDVARDADLFLAVARNLLANPPLKVPTLFGQDAAVRRIHEAIVAGAPAPLAIYGGRRGVDWSQFRPRGHYANSPELRRYFEAMMWLGRADLGFHLSPPAPGTSQDIDVARERADAVVIADLLRGAGQLDALGGIDRLLAYLVGASDNATPAHVAAALGTDGAGGLARLSDRGVAERVIARVAAPRQQILSQPLTLNQPSPVPVSSTLPSLFQFFGQRFVVDSFVLSRVVGDGTRMGGRELPSGLDVAAALGDDEAARVLRPELQRYGYAADLLAARTLLRERPAAAWDATAYDVWLDAVAQLGRAPGEGAVPQVMRSAAWRRKELQTQLSSWAELRHDTILYSKQSYGAGIVCEYPAGFVEPYPKAFARIAFFVDELGRRLAATAGSADHLKTFLGNFASHARRLQGLAEKELGSEPFSDDEVKFMKDTIHMKTDFGGCGGPPRHVFTGWYPTLLYSGAPDAWEPTIADVHTDPNGRALEVGVGDVDFLVVAVDNGRDRAAYVGPAYSYYEFPSATRLTDGEWREKLKAGQAPARPAWVDVFQAGAKQRAVLPPPENAKTAGPLAKNPMEDGALGFAAFGVGIRAIQPKLGACVDKYKLTARIEVLIDISPTGRVRSVAITQGGEMPAAAQRCLKEAVGSAVFEPSERGLSMPYSVTGM